VFRESTFSRETLPGRESRTSIPPMVWWEDAPHARPRRTFRSVWLAVGSAAIVGALILDADSRENGASQAANSSSDVEAPFGDPALNGAQLFIAQAATDAPVAVVPRSSVAIVDGKPTVFVAEPGLHLFVATPVELGERIGGDQRILAGLSAGQRVVAGDLSALERRLP
jgi:multidrug efflux pump subunit AcrA (membrane-fusion protein)